MKFQIEMAEYGLRFRREGFSTPEESKEILRQYLAVLATVQAKGTPFGQLVDGRGFRAVGREGQGDIETIMTRFRAAGGVRSAVILDDPVAVLQVKRLAVNAGLYEFERYLDPETFPDFERRAIDWIVSGIDPDAPQGAPPNT